MKRIPLNSISAAVYTRLTEYQDVPVYDDVSPRAEAPYIILVLIKMKEKALCLPYCKQLKAILKFIM